MWLRCSASGRAPSAWRSRERWPGCGCCSTRRWPALPGDDELLDLLAHALAPPPAEPSLAELTALQNAARYPLGTSRRWHWRWNRQSIAALVGVGVLATSGT